MSSGGGGGGGGGKGGRSKKKNSSQNNGRSSITIVVMGDEGVGKSSLISTFVSRHFSDMVPGIMTRVRLPPDTTYTTPRTANRSSSSSMSYPSTGISKNGFVTTIVDTQNGDAALLSALHASGGGGFGDTTRGSPSSSLTSLSGGGGGGGNDNNGVSTNRAVTTPGAMATPQAGVINRTTTQQDGSPVTTTSSSPSDGSSSGEAGGGDNNVVKRVVNSIEVDVIILVYDLDRIETFYRLENHWLPLIERCFGEEIPVILAGNKIDLRNTNTPNQSTPLPTTGNASSPINTTTSPPTISPQTERQAIVSLMQRFKFVRQCTKCSAKTLFHISEIFTQAQQAVLFPIAPLYDLRRGGLTDDCKRAFVRIFRMMDLDGDGLLSTSELKAFQNKCFRVWDSLLEENISGWKKIISKNISRTSSESEQPLIQDGKFTVAGFLTIFDIFMSKDRWEVPWKILRIFGYNDDLELCIPNSVIDGGGGEKLSEGSLRFLARVFEQFDKNNDGMLSEGDILSIFSIIPESSLPPWHPLRSSKLFFDTFSLPKLEMDIPLPPTPITATDQIKSDTPSKPSSLSADGIPITTPLNEPPLSPTTTHTNSQNHYSHHPCTFSEWIGYWHMIFSISPSVTRTELYRLGYVDSTNTRPDVSIPKSLKMPFTVLRIHIFGNTNCGKTALLSGLSHYPWKSLLSTEETKKPVTSCTHLCIQKSAKPMHKKKKKNIPTSSDHMVYLVITEVPVKIVKEYGENVDNLLGNTDLVVLAFDLKHTSLEFCMDVERNFLDDDVSRVFVATKTDLKDDEIEGINTTTTVLERAKQHCAATDLEPPLITNVTQTHVQTENSAGRIAILKHFVGCCLNDFSPKRSKPHAAAKKMLKEAKRKKILWFGGLLGFLAVGALWSKRGTWWRKWFFPSYWRKSLGN